jgi:hypothetical protein
MNQPVKGNAPTHIRIENLTDAPFSLPPVPPSKENPKGYLARELPPGGSNVLLAYVNAIREHEVLNAFGQKWKPHAEFFEKNTARIRIDPDPRAVNKREGVPLTPETFAKLPEKAAIDVAETESDTGTLGVLLKVERRQNVRAALASRIAKIS